MLETDSNGYSATEQFNDIIEKTKRGDYLKDSTEMAHRRIQLEAFNAAKSRGDTALAEEIVSKTVVDDSEDNPAENKIGVTKFKAHYLPSGEEPTSEADADNLPK